MESDEMNWLQDLFIRLLSPWIPIVRKIQPKVRYRVLTACFMADLVLFCIVRYVLMKESYFYNTVCGIFLMLVIAIFSLDKKLERRKWHKGLSVAWFGMCIMFTISDFLVSKKACGLGIILAFVLPGVFFVWQNNSRKDLLWKSLKDAVKISFLLMAVISFLFRPFFEGGRYAGIFTNPNTFGLYLYVIFAIYMSDLDWNVETGKKFRKAWPTYIQLALVLFYISVSQARTAMLAVCGILILWVVLRICLGKTNHKWKETVKGFLLLALITVVCYPVFFAGVRHIPNLVGHPILFEEDVLYLSNGEKIEGIGDKVLAESDAIESVQIPEPKEKKEFKENSIIGRLIASLDGNSTLNKISNGRITIYKAYLKKLNWKGHRRITLTVNGKKVAHAHNNWLQFAYTYGVPAMFLYLIITILSVIRSIQFYWTNRRRNATYAFLITAICVGFVIATLTECLFLPFEVFPAFMYWFAFGDLFDNSLAEAAE
ncbi:MAG: O-antigen ligase family protein [Eubacterium sp.]|nr:O-antigen ligase family protein [Eubacterium sp.]